MTKGKKICIYSPWMTSVGGIETHLLNISKALAASGWEVDFCVKYSALPSEVVARLGEDDVRYREFPHPAFFKSILDRRSLLYTNSQGNTPPLIWQVAGQQRRGFHHCHTSCSPNEMNLWAPRYKKFIGAGPPLVACSQATKTNILAWSPEREVVVMPYLTTTAEEARRFPTQTQTIQAKRNPGRWNFGFIGRLDVTKGIDVIIDASRHESCADVDWHFFGSGPEIERIEAAGGANLYWHGAFDRSMPLEAIYGGLHAVVLPSLHAEGSPLCLIEALSFGKPWIASHRGGIAELACSSEDHLMINPLDRGQFVEAVLKLKKRLLNEEVRAKEILAFYRANYSAQVVTRRWTDMLEASPPK